MKMEEPHNATLPQYIQSVILQHLCRSYKVKSLYLGLVCWRWFHYLVMFTPPKLVLKPMSEQNGLESMYQHTRSKYCIYKGISEITTKINYNHFTIVHSKEMETDYEWIRSFYGSLRTVSLHSNHSIEFIEQLFGDLIIKAENHFKLIHQQQLQVENEISNDRKEQGRIINLKNLLIWINHGSSTFQTTVSLITPFCRNLTSLNICLPLIYNADSIIHLLGQTVELKDLNLEFQVAKESNNFLPKLIDSFPLGIESLVLSVEGRVIPYHLLTRLSKLNHLITKDLSKEFIDFIISNQSITDLSGIKITFDSTSSPIFQHKQNITKFHILLTGQEFIDNQIQLNLHPLITQLLISFIDYDCKTMNYISTQCRHLTFIDVTMSAMNNNMMQNLVDFIKHSPFISTVYIDSVGHDENGTLIEKQQLQELYQCTYNSKTMNYLLLMIPRRVIEEYPETTDYDGWIIKVSNYSFVSIAMYVIEE